MKKELNYIIFYFDALKDNIIPHTIESSSTKKENIRGITENTQLIQN